MSLMPVLDRVSAALKARIPALRVEYGPAAGAKQGAPALIWEVIGGPIIDGAQVDDSHSARTLGHHHCKVVAELRARDTTQGTTNKDYAAAFEMLRQLVIVLKTVAPADYSAATDFTRNLDAGVSGQPLIVLRVEIEFRVAIQDDPWIKVVCEEEPEVQGRVIDDTTRIG